MITISKDTFRRISGIDFDHFLKHAIHGDDWGIFLKLATMLEASAKRSIGLKLDLNPDLESVGKLEFFTALRLCRDTSLIPEEAFNFANRVRLLRNDLVHSGSVLELTIDRIFEQVDGPKYLKSLDGFVRIESASAADNTQSHQNALLFACISFVGYVASSLFGEDWFARLPADHAGGP